MVLSNDLISKFVKITKDDKKTNNETTVYGTVVESNGTKYVRLDGAAENQLTPAIMTADAENGERVSVLIKDHTATVTGNISSPAARIDTVNVVTETVKAQNGKIANIEADNVEINKTLTAHNASMEEIEADNVEIKKTLTAQEAAIDELETNKLSTKDAEVKYANIDFANIDEAAIEKLFTDSGIIGDLVMSDGHVTGKLVGVTIIGDLIEGGTVKAEKLVIRGTDGLYYKLNTNGATVSSEQTEYNSLSGKIITAKSITAEKVNVDDLVAFGATIGGFHITEDSIYSGAKASIDNTTRGIYQDTDGQFAIGDANNFLKFYKDADGTYKLAIAASLITFGDSGKSVEEAITEIQNGVDNIEIGGRNLLKWTEILPIAETFNSSNGISKFESTLGTLESTDAGVKLIFDGKFNTSISVPLAYDGCIESGELLTLSFAYRGNIDKFGRIYFLQRTAPNVTPNSSFPDLVSSETEWQHYKATFSATSANDRINYQVLLFAGNTTYDSSRWIELKACSLKLEKGNKATDWTPAPEDVQADIDNAQNSASDAQAGVDANATTIEYLDGLIEKINGALNTLVTDDNGTTLLQQTGTGWSFNFSDIRNALDKYDSYIKLDESSDQPCIILGKTTSNFKVKITNTDIEFIEGSGNPVAKITSNDDTGESLIEIEKAKINGDLQQDNWIWQTRSNGNYGLIWKG